MSSGSPVPSIPCLVLDNGGCTLKIGFGGQARPIKTVSNCAVKEPKKKNHEENSSSSSSSLMAGYLLADEVDSLDSRSGLVYRRPHDQGYLTNFDLESAIWTRMFGPALLNVKTKDCALLLTDSLFSPTTLRNQMDELIYEKYEFSSAHRTCAPSLALRGYQYEVQSLWGATASLIVDIGYSFTHAVPLFNYSPVASAIRRLNVGGKVLTNYLKELITYRQINMNEETHLANEIKEKMCFVSTDFMREMKFNQNLRKGPGQNPAALRASLTREFILPNGTTRKNGIVRNPFEEQKPIIDKDDQILTLTNERITVPEALFHPSDLGLDQCGLAELIVESIEACNESLRADLYSHIILVGGSSLFPNLVERLQSDLRALVPDEFPISIKRSREPITTAWCGGSCLSIDVNFPQVVVSRKEYLEHGSQITMKKFAYP